MTFTARFCAEAVFRTRLSGDFFLKLDFSVWNPTFCNNFADLKGRNRQEDVLAMLGKYPLMNDYWEDKRAKIGKIQVPAYILASYSTGLHTVGSFRGYEEIGTKEKWFDTTIDMKLFLLIDTGSESILLKSGTISTRPNVPRICNAILIIS